jgi:hypothetical protein
MDTRTWAIVAIAVVILILGFFFLRPGRETPTTPPATTEQPAQPAPSN